MPISFFQADVYFQLPKKQLLKNFLKEKFYASTGKQLTLSYIFCSDNYLLKINQDFLKHDTFTDIITFPLAETQKKVTAEIYISTERVAENAHKQKVTESEEMLRVIFHGVLHLAGLCDKSKTEKAAMRAAEDKWLQAFQKSA